MGAFLGGEIACCCGGGGGQTCSDCDGVPSDFTLEVSGLTGDCYFSAPTDADRNGTYTVPPFQDCQWRCFDTGVAIDVYYDSGLAKYIVEAWLFGSTTESDRVVTWKKEYASKPTCSTLSAEALTFDSDVGTCDGTGSTCTITAGAAATRHCCTNGCATGERINGSIQAVITGVANLSPANCTTCTDFNSTFVLDFYSADGPFGCSCCWGYYDAGGICGDCDTGTGGPTQFYLDFSSYVEFNIYDNSPWASWTNTTLDTREWVCSNPGLYDGGDLVLGSSACCDFSGATITLSVV